MEIYPTRDRTSYRRVILLTLLALLVGWIFAYLQLPEPPPTHPSAQSSGPVVSGSLATAAYGSDIIFNAGAGNSIQVTLRGDIRTSSIANPQTGQFLTVLICQDNKGGWLMHWPEDVLLAGGDFPLSQEPNQCDSLTMVYNGSYWLETARALGLTIPEETAADATMPEEAPNEPVENPPSR